MNVVKVILADDDPLIRIDLKTAVEQIGHRVVGEAEDGRQAVSLSHSLHPDLVILDIIMPQIGGLEAAQTIYQEQLAAVILLTGYADEEMFSRADSVGVLAYLGKLVGRAKALLMDRYNVSEREAFHRIQSQSQSLQKPPQEIARAIITASDIGL